MLTQNETQEVQFLSLDEYEKIAKKIITKVGKEYPGLAHMMLNDNEAVGSVVNGLLKADKKWRSDHVCKKGKTGSCTLNTYRIKLARYKIYAYIKALSKRVNMQSLDDTRISKGNSDIFLKDIISSKQDDPQEILGKIEGSAANRKLIRRILTSDILTDREKKIIQMKYFDNDGDGTTLQEIANQYNLTKQCISLILKGAFKKIRNGVYVD